MMFPGPIFEGLKVSHPQFGFGILQATLNKITLAFTVGEGGEVSRTRGIGQTITNTLTFALEQQGFLTNRACAADRPDRIAGKLDMQVTAFGGAERDFFPDRLWQQGKIRGFARYLSNNRELLASTRRSK